MKLLTIGILLFVGISCARTNENGYEIKRFHIQSRQLDGKPQCVEIRRKRSTREADYIEKIDMQPSSNGQDDIAAEQKSIEDEATDAGNNLTDIVIKRSDLAGSSAILIIESPSLPNVPLVFAMRPVSSKSKNNKNVKIQIFSDSSFNEDDDDEEINDDFADLGDEMMDDFEDYPEGYKESDEPKLRQIQISKQKQSVYSQIAESGEDLMEFIVKQTKQSNERKSNLKKLRIQILKEYLSQNKQNYLNTVDVLRKLRNYEDYDGGSDLSRSDCIIIEKEPELQQRSANEKSSEDFLSVDAGGRMPNRSYGLRKRYKGRRNNSNKTQFKF